MKSTEFERRRKQLMRMVGTGGIAILPAAPVRMRSRDVEYRYRQDSDFYYLTGFAEPEAVAVLVPITFTMPPASALILMGAIYTGAIYGGAYAAILLNTPGTPSSSVTTRRRLTPHGTSFSFLQAVTQPLHSMQRSASHRNFILAMV